MTVDIQDYTNQVDLNAVGSFNIEQIEKLWNSLKIKGLRLLEEKDQAIKNKCIEMLEKLYRKPWDESIFFKIIQMRLDQVEANVDKSVHLSQIQRLFSELQMTCPFLPKNQMKRLLELRSEFLIQKMRSGGSEDQLNQLIMEEVEILVECKKKGFNANTLIGPKLLELFRGNTVNLKFGKEFASLILECEEFKELQVDLLNTLTELTLNLAIESKRSIKQFSELITDAINLNVRSLALKPNVLGYFEFLKLTRLQYGNINSSDFDQAIETCLLTLKNRINPNEDIRGKLQIIQLIMNETGKLEKGINFAIELFSNCDFSGNGPLIMEELLEAIERHGKDLFQMITELLEKFSDQLRSSRKCQIGVLEMLLRLAEKNSTVIGDFRRAEEIFKVIQNLNSDYRASELKFKMIKCYLRLDKLSEAKAHLDQLDQLDPNESDTLLLRLEYSLRSQNEFDSLNLIEKLTKIPESRSEHFLNLYNILKSRIPPELKMKLLKAAKSLCKLSGPNVVDIERGIVGLLYEGILENGLTEGFKVELETSLNNINTESLTTDQRVWCCQVCWNLGVIHARAEDFINAQFCFKWCHLFSKTTLKEFTFKSAFYYLTAKMFNEEAEISDDDFVILDGLNKDNFKEFEGEVLCLKVEMLLKTKKWADLECLITTTGSIMYETLAEIVLRTCVDVPLKIYHMALSTLTERALENKCDLMNFSKLFRGMITCSLLQYPSDLSHFHTALKIIKSSFGGYPGDEITWLCATALEMGRQAIEAMGDWPRGSEWTDMAMNLVYLIPDSEKETKNSLKESIQELFEKIVNRL